MPTQHGALPTAANETPQVAQAVERILPCLGCLNSAIAGKSNGECWDHPDKTRYERCDDEGGSCQPIPDAALPAALYFLDFCRAHPDPGEFTNAEKKEKRHRLTMIQHILEAIASGAWPLPGDPRLDD
ncbi:hypothetical protein FGADI_6437 [Fusarium gaditjirri]|uniref:Uncharacterized protein n=1 Tax=Fusarium gaditjirri TaxID=282569 RepID=A0A8H4WVZ7_9HYPO|nr:hypothetical protein FGADI_6437 [Fusarium gaditjirri]